MNLSRMVRFNQLHPLPAKTMRRGLRRSLEVAAQSLISSFRGCGLYDQPRYMMGAKMGDVAARIQRVLSTYAGKEKDAKALALTFIIAKAQAMREVSALMVPVLVGLSEDGITTESRRNALLKLISSKEYIELRAKCERLSEMVGSQSNLIFKTNFIFDDFHAGPRTTDRILRHMFWTLDHFSSNEGSDHDLEYLADRLDRDPTLARPDLPEIEDVAHKLRKRLRLKPGDLEQSPAESAATRDRLFDLAKELEQMARQASKLEAKARSDYGGASQLLDDKVIAAEVLARSPWYSGTFYLTAFVVVIAAVSVAQRFVSAWAFPLVLIGGISATTVIGAFQLRNDDRLSEKHFLDLMRLSFGRLDLLVRFWRPRTKLASTDARPQ